MSDLFRGYDLTTVADKVAESQWTKRRGEALARGFDEEKLAEWADLDPVGKLNFKSTLLPIITDVLEALESPEVKPVIAREMVEYDYNNADRTDPRWYENQDHQHSTETATVWALHLHVSADFSGENRERILERMSILPEPTGEYTWGDSWRQWGEPPEGLNDVHMCIYFKATPERAAEVGRHLATHAIFAMHGPRAEVSHTSFAVSTAGDYAEQVPVH